LYSTVINKYCFINCWVNKETYSLTLLNKGLTISPSKSALMIFTEKRTNLLDYSISLNNIDIYSVSSYRFLGVLLELHLTGKLHAKFLINKCGKLANVIKFLRGVWWGSCPKTMLIIYKAMIRGSFDYASFLFPFYNANLTENLERVSRRALRYCIGLRRSAPCNVVYAESGIGLARLRCQLICWPVNSYLSHLLLGPASLLTNSKTFTLRIWIRASAPICTRDFLCIVLIVL